MGNCGVLIIKEFLKVDIKNFFLVYRMTTFDPKCLGATFLQKFWGFKEAYLSQKFQLRRVFLDIRFGFYVNTQYKLMYHKTLKHPPPPISFWMNFRKGEKKIIGTEVLWYINLYLLPFRVKSESDIKNTPLIWTFWFMGLKWTEFSRKEPSHIGIEPRKRGLKFCSSIRLNVKYELQVQFLQNWLQEKLWIFGWR